MDDCAVIIPVFDEDHAVIETLVRELASFGAEVIVIDDGSQNPYPSAIKHGANFGYGAALMTGIKNATRDLILTMDGDGQHSVSEAVKLYHAFKLIGSADMVVGARRIKNEPLHRFLGRKFLNWTASFICTNFISDLNSGARIFRRGIALGYFPILCRSFSFTTSITMSMMCDEYSVEYFPIRVEKRKNGITKVRIFRHGFTTLKYILWIGVALRTRRLRSWLRSLPWIGRVITQP